ncbi:MAG: hypothetical protein ACOZNI_13405 [Myxococcota bacterium]
MGDGGGKGGGTPHPAEARHRFHLPALQSIGMPILGLVTLLAVLGVFDPAHESRLVWAGDLAVVVRWPTRLRETQAEVAEIELRNEGTAPFSASVAFEGAWLDAFRDVHVDPGAEEARSVAFADIGPGESRRVRVQLRAERSGWHRGTVHVLRTPGDRVAAVPVGTWVLP